MNLEHIENFVFYPDPNSASSGTLYILGKERSYGVNSFVLIQYRNPRVEKPNPKYYPVLETKKTELETSSQIQPKTQLKPRYNKEQYLEKIKAIKSHIHYGNIYEINFCMDFMAEQAELDPISTFIRLQERAKAPYAALVKIGPEYILCASPELFLQKKGNRLISKPIKGTAPRGKNETEDLKFKTELQNSLKERTENVMAVDVARNDLSIFAKKASVKVDTLFGIETFETVHQMVSTVTCEVEPTLSFEKMIEATFPMASMTGAPKQMAMDLIDSFEDFERGFYSGSFGLVDEKGDFSLNVVIRSIFYESFKKQIRLAVGGAITYLSDPEKEYEECLLKAKNMLAVLEDH